MAHSSFVRQLRHLIHHSIQRCSPNDCNKKLASSSRRKFLQHSAAAGVASVALNSPMSAWAFADPLIHRQKNVVVVGAGMAGLNAAYQLKKAGVAVSLYEASGRVGGRVFSKTGAVAPNMVTEMGGELINSDHADMLSLVEEFGLSLFNRVDDATSMPFTKTAYYFDGTHYSGSEIADGLREIAAQMAADNALLDADYDTYAPQFDALSAAVYLHQHANKIPHPVFRHLLECSIRTEYGVEPGESSALQLLSLLVTVDDQEVELLGYSDEMYTIAGGNSQLAESLAAALQSEIHMNKKLMRVSKDGKKYLLEFDSELKIKTDFVIFAIPFSALRNIELNVHLPKKMRRFIQELDLGRNEKIIAGFSTKAWRQQTGFDLEAWSDMGFSEVWDGSQNQTMRDDGALTFFLGGKDTSIMPLGADKAGEVFVHRLDARIPGLIAAATGCYTASHWSKNPLTHGAYSSFKPGQLTEFSEYFWIESDDPANQQKVLVDQLVFAGEQLSDSFYGFMNGAAQTGRLAAQSVLERLGATHKKAL